MQLLIPFVRADLAIDEVYVYTNEAPLECLITVIFGLQDRETSSDIIEAWNTHTIAFFSLEIFRFHHFFLKRYQLLLLQATCQKMQ